VPTPSRWGAALLLGVGVASAATSRRVLVGLYEPVHAWLDWVALLSLASALARGLRTDRGRRAPLGIAAAVALGGFVGAAAVIAVRLDEPTFRSALSQSTSGMKLLEASADAVSAAPPGPPEMAPAALGLAPVSRAGAFDNDFNVLLVTVDGMRADYVTPGRAPRIFELSRRSAFFERAYAQGSKTAIGMSTLMTGRYSAYLSWQLWAGIGKQLYRAEAPELREHAGSHLYTSLPDFAPGSLLAERLRARGFLTLAAPDGGPTGFFRPTTGFARGFHQLVDIGALDVPLPSSKAVAGIAVAQRRAAPRRRWFQWVHLYDPHRLMARPDYDRLVRAADQGVALLLDALAADGLGERTIVVLTADHGRALAEHGGSGHAWALYDEQIRVPLIIFVPGMAPVVVPDPVACIDATATMLVLAGASLAGVQGRNLLPAMGSGRVEPQRPIYSELHAHRSTSGQRSTDMKAVIDGSLKLIVDRKRGLLELYDLASDPNETTNLIGARPDDTRRLYRLERGFFAEAARHYALP
jgi:arylsulfatase A-like enzyme